MYHLSFIYTFSSIYFYSFVQYDSWLILPRRVDVVFNFFVIQFFIYTYFTMWETFSMDVWKSYMALEYKLFYIICLLGFDIYALFSFNVFLDPYFIGFIFAWGIAVFDKVMDECKYIKIETFKVEWDWFNKIATICCRRISYFSLGCMIFFVIVRLILCV